MQKKIRILAIAPYESMRPLLLEAAKEFDDVEVNVFVGDLSQGLALAKHNFYNDHDVIISRGGTASMLKEQLDLPIVEVELSPMDILRSMRAGGRILHDYAIVGFPNITKNAEIICQVMDVDIDIRSINGAEDLEGILNNLAEKGTRAILCDMVAYTTSLKKGLDPVLIKSSIESVRSAVVRAREVYYTHQKLREENRFLRSLIWKHINHTLVLDEDGAIFFSTMENNNEPIVDYLKSERQREYNGQDIHMVKQINNVRYSIRLTKEYLAGRLYTVYYFTENKVSLPDIKYGIRYLGQPEALQEFSASIYGVIGMHEETYQRIEQLKHNQRPLLLYGEDGTCKEQVVKYLYLQSDWSNKPLVLIDCFMLGQKSWDHLMEHHNSPLTLTGCTLYFKNVDVLTSIQRKQLLANLMEMNVCRQNRVIFSSICNNQEAVTEAGKDLLECLCCVKLALPPLRVRAGQIPNMILRYFHCMDEEFQGGENRLEPEAVSLLQQYQWPHNYTQFQRVLEELITVRTGMITAADVRRAIHQEQIIATVSNKVDDANIRINLNQSLEKINEEIVKKVLELEHGNRTSAANRLQIGRSTLWRLIKKVEQEN